MYDDKVIVLISERLITLRSYNTLFQVDILNFC